MNGSEGEAAKLEEISSWRWDGLDDGVHLNKFHSSFYSPMVSEHFSNIPQNPAHPSSSCIRLMRSFLEIIRIKYFQALRSMHSREIGFNDPAIFCADETKKQFATKWCKNCSFIHNWKRANTRVQSREKCISPNANDERYASARNIIWVFFFVFFFRTLYCRCRVENCRALVTTRVSNVQRSTEMHMLVSKGRHCIVLRRVPLQCKHAPSEFTYSSSKVGSAQCENQRRAEKIM